MGTRLLQNTVVLLVLPTACVLGPKQEQMIISSQPTSFSGLASQPSAEIIIEALDLSTNTWETIGTTTTTPIPANIGAHDYYYFNTNVTVRSASGWECYYDDDCDLADEGCYDITFRVREPIGLTATLFTFSQESFDCTFDLVIEQFEDSWDSYALCAPDLPTTIVARSCFIY